jgi:L-threonylcarbamoyladenylate synthase
VAVGSGSTTFHSTTVSKRSRLLGLDDLDAVARSLAGGSLAILPTETGYMLAALATSPRALEAAFQVKQRDRIHVMHVACASLEMARQFAVIDEPAARVIGAFTPGPLSVVLPQTDRLPDSLVTVNGTVGIRVPDVPATLQVIAAVGAPLTATSLNVSGSTATPLDEAGLGRLAWPQGSTVHIVVDDEAVTYSQPSTLIRMVGTDVEVLRPGPVGLDAVRAVLAA